jgi:hypothetical protein
MCLPMDQNSERIRVLVLELARSIWTLAGSRVTKTPEEVLIGTYSYWCSTVPHRNEAWPWGLQTAVGIRAHNDEAFGHPRYHPEIFKVLWKISSKASGSTVNFEVTHVQVMSIPEITRRGSVSR